MEDNIHSIESLFEKAGEYGKTSFELVKLQAVDMVTDRISSVIPNFFVILLSGTFMVFVNVGVALWVGKLLGSVFYGFFVVAGFYGLLALVSYLFLRKSIKRSVYDSMIKQLLK
jgi:hypothetical protein